MADQPEVRALLEQSLQARHRATAYRKVAEAYARLPSEAAVAAALHARLNWERATAEACDRLVQATGLLSAQVTALERDNAELRDRNAQLCADNERLKLDLRRQLGVQPKRMTSPPTPTAERPPTAVADSSAAPRRRGAPAGHRGATRPPPLAPDYIEVRPPPAVCHCGCTEVLPLDQYDEQIVEDIPPVVRILTLVRWQHGHCSRCGAHLRPAVAGPPVVTGPNLAALLTLMRHLGLTHRKLALLSTEGLGVPLSPAGAMGVVNRVCDRLAPLGSEILSRLRQQDWIGADETGWRIERRNGYIWCFCNRRLVWFEPDPSRAAEVPKRILGADFPGTVLCDFYGGYNFLSQLQRCWVHLLRDIEDERRLLPASATLERFAQATWDAYHTAVATQALPEGPPKNRAVSQMRRRLLALARRRLPTGNPQALARRIGKHLDQLLHFVHHPDIEPHNNRTERQVRPLVTCRKNSFGSDTIKGARRLCLLASVLETCRLNGHRLLTWLRNALAAPPDCLPSPFAQPDAPPALGP